jgi:hypothetical protein
MSDKPKQISIWFFVGVLLAIYGVIILGAGIDQWMNPAAHPVVLADLHVGVWWGAVLFIIGCVYSYVFAPNRAQK